MAKFQRRNPFGYLYQFQGKKHVYINGSHKNQLKIVDFLDTDKPKGIGFGNLCKNHSERK